LVGVSEDRKTVQSNKDKIMLHACCAPCAAYVIDVLSDSYNVTTLFYNPNIQPEKEYNKRLKDMEKLCALTKTELLILDYDVELWNNCIRGLEDEPEGAGRCRVCFDARLEKTAETALQKGFHLFTTTLTVSPHKNSHLINTIGHKKSGKFSIRFLERDFKKNNGYKTSCELSSKYGLYRQKYCGCIFSR
jgi:hypothetical protein